MIYPDWIGPETGQQETLLVYTDIYDLELDDNEVQIALDDNELVAEIDSDVLSIDLED